MTKIRTLMKTTLLAGGLSCACLIPALALTLDGTAASEAPLSGTRLSLATEAEAPIEVAAAGDGTSVMGMAAGAGTLGAAVAATTEAMRQPQEAPAGNGVVRILDESAFIGKSVLTADGKPVGKIDRVWLDGAGKSHVDVRLDPGVARDHSRVSVPLDAEAQSDGMVTLSWTEAELLEALEAQPEAG